MPSMFKGKAKAPELERMNVDTGAELRRGQNFNVDWAGRWQKDIAPGMDAAEKARIEGMIDPRQKELESQTADISQQLQKTGATAAMGDFQRYMRLQGMQVAAGIGGSPITGGFAQSVATKLGMMQTLQNQIQGTQLGFQIGNVWDRRMQEARQPANVLFQSNMINPQAFLQSALTQAQVNTDISNQQKIMNFQAKNTPAPWESALTGLATTAAGAAITGGIGAAFAPAASSAIGGGVASSFMGGVGSGLGSSFSSGLANHYSSGGSLWDSYKVQSPEPASSGFSSPGSLWASSPSMNGVSLNR